ncbi:MAG: FkbM family methyltransferase [Coleofasciculaceae cyanobacterium]
MNLLQNRFFEKFILIIFGNHLNENILRYLCLNNIFRRYFKVGALAFAYSSHLKKSEIRISTIGNYQVYVNIAENQGVHLYFFGNHNEPFAAWLTSQLLNEGDISIDVGANMGSYTFIMASRVKPTGKVFAFEPNPTLFTNLNDSVTLNKCQNFISVDSRALYSNSGKILKFYISDNPSNSGTSSLINHGVFVSEENFVLVNTVTLTNYFLEKQIERCKLIKIDVERAELEVLQGASELLEKRIIDYIILEQLAGSSSQKLLFNLGYSCWLIDEQNKKLIPVHKIADNSFGNYIFVNPNQINQFEKEYFNIIV